MMHFVQIAFRNQSPIRNISHFLVALLHETLILQNNKAKRTMQTSIEALITATYRDDEYPVCLHQAREWRRTQPLKGVTILDAAPVFRNTLVKHLALISAGAELIVGISDIMPRDERIVDLLRNAGIPTICPNDAEVPVDIILDCAAAFAHWQPCIGFVELTRSGVEKFSSADKPVFVADNGRIKRIETCLGTGESYYRAMKKLGYDDWEGKKLIVFGSGKVGTGIIMYAHKLGAKVTVVTQPESITSQAAALATEIIDYKDSAKVAQAVKDAYAIVTATGVPHALEGNCPAEALITSPALLANMGVEDEYGPSIPPARVLESKKTLNFILDEPTHLKYIDPTMALHNEGALYLITHPEACGLIEPPTEMEENLLEICRINGCISDELNLI